MTSPEPCEAFRRILVPTDFGEASVRALALAVDLATECRSRLTLLHVYEIPIYAYPGVPPLVVDVSRQIRDAARKRLDGELTEIEHRVPDTTGVLSTGTPWQEILKQSEASDSTLIVMGTHGRRGLEAVLLGSVAEKIVRLSPVPVLTVH